MKKLFLISFMLFTLVGCSDNLYLVDDIAVKYYREKYKTMDIYQTENRIIYIIRLPNGDILKAKSYKNENDKDWTTDEFIIWYGNKECLKQ